MDHARWKLSFACAGESGETGQSYATGDKLPDPQWRPLRGGWGSLARDHHWAFPGDMPRLADQADVAISAWGGIALPLVPAPADVGRGLVRGSWGVPRARGQRLRR